MNYDAIPAAIYSNLLGLAAFQEAYALTSYIESAQRVLIVGETSGRDYYYLTALGRSVVALDIARNLRVPNMIQANAEHTFPFADTSFDAVIMSEVLEHLYNDIGALAQARRVLRDQGVLAITIPFWDDAPFHSRIHSPRTIRLLLETQGFEIFRFYERGALLGLTPAIVSFCALVYHLKHRITGRDNRVAVYFKILKAISEFNLSHRLPRLWPTSRYHGCYLAARKSDFRSFLEVQDEHFKRGGLARPTD
jgi:SAM-dependent methyltransferase